MLEPREFFGLEGFDHRGVFAEEEPIWRSLDRLKSYLESCFAASWPLRGISGPIDRPLVVHEGVVVRGEGLDIGPTGTKGKVEASREGRVLVGAAILMPGVYLFDDRVLLGPGTVVEPGALLKGPLVVGADTEIRQGAYVRGDCLIGSGCVVGHTTEIKASIMLDGAKAGHFAYIGDSILGRDVNLGAGTKLANLKMIAGTVVVPVNGQRVDTARRKLGAVLGDRTETGCNSVTSPGTLMGPGSIVYPTMAVPAGYHPAATRVRPGRDAVHVLHRRD